MMTVMMKATAAMMLRVDHHVQAACPEAAETRLPQVIYLVQCPAAGGTQFPRSGMDRDALWLQSKKDQAGG